PRAGQELVRAQKALLLGIPFLPPVGVMIAAQPHHLQVWGLPQAEQLSNGGQGVLAAVDVVAQTDDPIAADGADPREQPAQQRHLTVQVADGVGRDTRPPFALRPAGLGWARPRRAVWCAALCAGVCSCRALGLASLLHRGAYVVQPCWLLQTQVRDLCRCLRSPRSRPRSDAPRHSPLGEYSIVECTSSSACTR